MDFLVPERLETERLRLRQLVMEDWRDLHEYYSDPIATQFTVGHGLTEGETWRMLCTILGHWQLRGYGPYAAEERSTGKVLGLIGLWYPIDWPDPEIKWALARAHWGKGFASEAARTVQSMAAERLPEARLISFIRSENRPSIRLALAVGATFDEEVPFRGTLWSIYRHPCRQVSSPDHVSEIH